MATTSITLPPGYGYVLAVAASSTAVNFFHVLLTSRRRKAAGVPYPNAYASVEEAAKDPVKHAFNCAQKAHSNFVENYPQFLVSLGISGLSYPIAAASLGAGWVVGRLMYAWGYSRVGKQYSDNGKGRLIGAWAAPLLYFLSGQAIYTTVKAIL